MPCKRNRREKTQKQRRLSKISQLGRKEFLELMKRIFLLKKQQKIAPLGGANICKYLANFHTGHMRIPVGCQTNCCKFGTIHRVTNHLQLLKNYFDWLTHSLYLLLESGNQRFLPTARPEVMSQAPQKEIQQQCRCQGRDSDFF